MEGSENCLVKTKSEIVSHWEGNGRQNVNLNMKRVHISNSGFTNCLSLWNITQLTNFVYSTYSPVFDNCSRLESFGSLTDIFPSNTVGKLENSSGFSYSCLSLWVIPNCLSSLIALEKLVSDFSRVTPLAHIFIFPDWMQLWELSSIQEVSAKSLVAPVEAEILNSPLNKSSFRTSNKLDSLRFSYCTRD